MTLSDEAATGALGAALADAVLALTEVIRGAGLVIGVCGDLGAGKTALVRAMLRRVGVSGAIKSPTFALLEPYELSRLNFYHFDFYRFTRPAEFRERGFGEYFERGAVCLVEWPERAQGAMPGVDLEIQLSVQAEPGHWAAATDDGESGRRQVLIRAHTPIGRRCLQLLSPAESP